MYEAVVRSKDDAGDVLRPAIDTPWFDRAGIPVRRALTRTSGPSVLASSFVLCLLGGGDEPGGLGLVRDVGLYVDGVGQFGGEGLARLHRPCRVDPLFSDAYLSPQEELSGPSGSSVADFLDEY